VQSGRKEGVNEAQNRSSAASHLGREETRAARRTGVEGLGVGVLAGPHFPATAWSESWFRLSRSRSEVATCCAARRNGCLRDPHPPHASDRSAPYPCVPGGCYSPGGKGSPTVLLLSVSPSPQRWWASVWQGHLAQSHSILVVIHPVTMRVRLLVDVGVFLAS
jgi:hypothetical protein